MNSQARKNRTEISPQKRSMRLKISSIVRLSPLPKYCAPRMEPAAVPDIRNMFCTNWIWVASDTAVISSCATRPSIRASNAATMASIRLWKAMGNARVHRRL